MFERPFWKKRARAMLDRHHVLWIAGARRSGKTVLCRQLEDARYHDCELPRVRRALEDPELFFRKHEVDFIVRPGRGRSVTALECKASSSHLDPAGLLAFRRRYPRGENIVVCLDIAGPIDANVRGLDVRLVPFERLDEECRRLVAGGMPQAKRSP